LLKIKFKIFKFKIKYQFNEYSGLFLLISNSGADAFYKVLTMTLSLLKDGMLDCVAMVVAPSYGAGL
jgi:hypothetical protein